MSLITCCPACGTLFKVVPDQLRISEGWVRCGHCGDVFDASAHLQGSAALPQGDTRADAAVAPLAELEPEPEPEPDESEAPPESETFESSSPNTEIGETISFEPPDSQQIDEEAQALVEHPLDRPFELRRRDDGEGETALLPAESEADSEQESQLEDEMHEVSFVRDARRQSSWEQPRVRAALSVAVLMLTALLALQFSVHERDRVAAASPALRPWLASLCAALDCRIGPPRQIEAIAIDSSSFNRLRSDAYRLSVNLKNRADVTVALPALELTLTDAQDQAVLRRVLMPSELGAPAGVIAASSEWSGSLAIAVAPNGSDARIAGYRLLAFYP